MVASTRSYPADQADWRKRGKGEELAGIAVGAVQGHKTRAERHVRPLTGLQDSNAYSREVIADLQQTEDFKEGVNRLCRKTQTHWVNKNIRKLTARDGTSMSHNEAYGRIDEQPDMSEKPRPQWPP